MIKLSFRDIDKEFNLSPEEISLKNQLMENVSGGISGELYDEFIHSVNSEVSGVVDDYISSLYKNDPRYKKVREIDTLWDKLPIEVRQGKVPSAEADRLEKLGETAQGELEEYQEQLKEKMRKIKSAMVSQAISWKVE